MNIFKQLFSKSYNVEMMDYCGKINTDNCTPELQKTVVDTQQVINDVLNEYNRIGTNEGLKYKEYRDEYNRLTDNWKQLNIYMFTIITSLKKHFNTMVYLTI